MTREPTASGAPRLIVAPDDFPPVFADSAALARLRRAADMEVRVFTTPPGDQYKLLERIADAHTVIGMRSSTRYSHPIFEGAPYLRHLALWGTATDHVSLDAARRAEIVVTNTPGTATDAVAEHALALAFSLARRIPELDARVREGQWPRGRVMQLTGKTMGVVGTGSVGLRMAHLARGIGMHVLQCSMHDGDRSEGGQNAAADGEIVSFHRVLRESDVISLHARVTRHTVSLFGADQFAHMKPTALLVNTARGQLIDEMALTEALRNETIAGAALDVFSNEPLPSQHPLRFLRNVILTPHTAGSTNEALDAGLNMMVDNVLSFLAGHPENRVK